MNATDNPAHDETGAGELPTRFTERFGCRHPFASAGMAFAGMTVDLAAAVCSAGGLGAIGVGMMSPADLRAAIHELRRRTDAPFVINFITCFDNEANVEVCVDEGVPIVSFHWGHPPEPQLRSLLGAGVSVWEQVGSTEDARRAAGSGVEVVIAQGWEAGGHNYGGLPTMVLTPSVVDAVAPTLVLASGGIVDGRQAAAALCLGADGVWVGTRLVASAEANVHPEHHRRLVATSGEDTVRTGIFGPEMPHFNPMRVLRNTVVDEYTDRLDEVPVERDGLEEIGRTPFAGQDTVMRKFNVLLPVPGTTGDFEEMPWLAGQGTGLIREIRPAAEIVTEMMDVAAATLRAVVSPS